MRIYIVVASALSNLCRFSSTATRPTLRLLENKNVTQFVVPKMNFQSVVVSNAAYSNIKKKSKTFIIYRKVFQFVKLRQRPFENRPAAIMQRYGQWRDLWVPPFLRFYQLLWLSHLKHWTHYWQFRLWCTLIGALKPASSTMWDQSFSVMSSQKWHHFSLSVFRHYCSAVCYTSLAQISALADPYVSSGPSKGNKFQ